MTIHLGAAPLTTRDILAIARNGAAVALDDAGLQRIETGYRALEALAAGGAAIYGVSTGLGAGVDTRITPDPVVETDPTWSADGKILAFGRVDTLHPEKAYIALYALDKRELTPLPGSQGIFAPRWSPNGRYIIAITAGGNDKLMLYDVKEAKWRELPLDIRSFGYLSWSADSTSIYFDTYLSGTNGFYRVRISDGKLEKIADLSKLRQYNDQFGPSSWTGIDPHDVPLIPRDISTQEIYAFDLDLP